MIEIKSGKELCNEFFNNLLTMKDADTEIKKLLKELYARNKFSTENILTGLDSLREDEAKDEQQNKIR